MDAIKDRLRGIFVQALRLDIPAEQVGDQNLIHALGIDSIKALEILVWVEDEFGIAIEDGDLTADMVDSLDTLAAYIQRRQTATSLG